MPGRDVEVGIKEWIVGNGLEVELLHRPHIVAEKRLGKWRWGLVVLVPGHQMRLQTRLMRIQLVERPGSRGNSGIVRKILHGA
eukprot:1166969-Rhodomonas_salina.1